MRLLDITLLDGKVERVSIRRRGLLAVHKATNGYPAWRVTHIPTSMALPLLCCSEKHALALATKLSSLDWDFHTLPMPHSEQIAARDAVLSLQKRCEPCLLDIPFIPEVGHGAIR